MSNNHSKKLTIEWAPFKLAEGVNEATLLTASEKLQSEFVGKQSGFIRRELVKIGDNEWADIVYWNSLEEAQQVAENAAECPVCVEYFELMAAADINDPGAGVAHFEVVKTYQKN